MGRRVGNARTQRKGEVIGRALSTLAATPGLLNMLSSQSACTPGAAGLGLHPPTEPTQPTQPAHPTPGPPHRTDEKAARQRRAFPSTPRAAEEIPTVVRTHIHRYYAASAGVSIVKQLARVSPHPKPNKSGPRTKGKWTLRFCMRYPGIFPQQCDSVSTACDEFMVIST